jgi:hypothetical protein
MNLPLTDRKNHSTTIMFPAFFPLYDTPEKRTIVPNVLKEAGSLSLVQPKAEKKQKE